MSITAKDLRERYDRIFQLQVPAERESMLLGLLGDVILWIEDREKNPRTGEAYPTNFPQGIPR
jgi:hypothetical protein